MSKGTVNKVILLGRLGQDPATRFTQGGAAVCKISIATDESYTDKSSGERVNATEWHKIVFFGKLAEVVASYLKKGSIVYVEGKLKTQKWQDKNGADRYVTEVVASEMQMLGGDKQQNQHPHQATQTATSNINSVKTPTSNINAVVRRNFEHDDVPF